MRYPASGTEDLTDGQVLTAPWHHQLEMNFPDAPNEMAFFAIGYDVDEDLGQFFGGLGTIGTAFPSQLPTNATQGGDAGGEFAEALVSVILPDGITDTGRYVTLDTGNTGVHFTMRCILNVHFTPPADAPVIDPNFMRPGPRERSLSLARIGGILGYCGSGQIKRSKTSVIADAGESTQPAPRRA